MMRRRLAATPLGAGWAALVAALCLASSPAASSGTSLVLEVADEAGEILFSRTIAEEERWCVRWNHSVAGFTVSDCYRHEGGRMLLEKSHQPDFAAGLGHIEGRGVMRTAQEGGYWIEAIDEPVPGNCYRLRVGSPRVDHRIRIGGEETSLTALASGRAVSVALHDGRKEDVRC